MIRRIEHENGVVTYQSDLLRDAGVRHAFSTRIGGVSDPPYDTLNLGCQTKAWSDQIDARSASRPSFSPTAATAGTRGEWPR